MQPELTHRNIRPLVVFHDVAWEDISSCCLVGYRKSCLVSSLGDSLVELIYYQIVQCGTPVAQEAGCSLWVLYYISHESRYPRAKFITVYPASRMLYLMRLMQEAHLEPKRFQLVYPEAEKAANLVLIEAVKDAKPMLHPMEPLIIYNKDHTLTNRLKSVYNIEEQEKG